MHQRLDRNPGSPADDPEFFHSHHHSVDRLSTPTGEVMQQLQLDQRPFGLFGTCLLYTSDAADE